jgi:hypothetical protein
MLHSHTQTNPHRPLLETHRKRHPRNQRMDLHPPNQKLSIQLWRHIRILPRHAMLPKPRRHQHRNRKCRLRPRLRCRIQHYPLRPRAVLHGQSTRRRRHQHLGAQRKRMVQSREYQRARESIRQRARDMACLSYVIFACLTTY